MDQKTINRIILVLLAAGIAIALFAAFKKPTVAPPTPGPAPAPGPGNLFDTAVNAITPVLTNFFDKCDPNKPGYRKSGKRDVKCDSTTIAKYCDCSRPGYATDGKVDSLCNSGAFQYQSDCA